MSALDRGDTDVLTRGVVADRDDAAEMYRVHVGTIHRYLSARVGPEVGEELTAQTFVEAWARRDSYDPERGAQGAWLMGIAANVLRHHFRQEGRRARAHLALSAQQRLVDLADTMQEEVSDGLAAAERWASLRAAFGELSGPDREVLVLACHPDLSYAAMAEELEIPIGTLRSRLSRARRRLAVHMSAVPAR